MDKHEAELEIRALVAMLDAAREAGDDATVARINGAIAELKKITGPRQIVGTMHIGGAPPEVQGAGAVEDFETWRNRET